jgi:hypothetical protein
MSFGNDPGVSGQAKRKAELLMAQAEAAPARRQAGRRSFFLRLIDRLLRRAPGCDGTRA